MASTSTVSANSRDTEAFSSLGLGTAPLDDPMFRAAIFEQLGEHRLEGAVTTDICGKKDSHAVSLDKEAVDTIKKSRLHQKVATVIFFESNGGQLQAYATLPEIRMGVGEPDLDIANVETALEALVPPDGACYYIDTTKNRYWFSIKPNLKKLLSDRRASVKLPKIEERIRTEVQKVFTVEANVDCVFFPDKSGQIPNRPALTFVILAPDQSMQNEVNTLRLVESMMKEHGTSARTFKNSLVWCVPETPDALREGAIKALAWEDINDERDELRLDEGQQRQLAENLKKAQRDLTECVWRTYKNIMLLAKDNTVRVVDLGLVHSSSANTIVDFIISTLRKEDEVTDYIQPRQLLKNWPPAFTEWSTKAVRDAVFASPQFARLLNPDSIKETVARGVSAKLLAYVAKSADGHYDPFCYGGELSAGEVEISDDVFIITGEEAKKHIEPPKLTSLAVTPQDMQIEPGKKQTFVAKGLDQHNREISIENVSWSATGGVIDTGGVFLAGEEEGNFIVKATIGQTTGSTAFTIAKPGTVIVKPVGVKKLSWRGEVPSQKWMNFYTKVLTKFTGEKSLKLSIHVEVAPEEGISKQKLEETKVALRELGLNDDVDQID
jgi:hypothetical protein